MNMRYFKLYIIPVLVAAVVSCTKAEGLEGGVSPEGRAVSISVGVDSPEGGASGVEAAGAGLPATRAEGSTPYSGSTLGLFLDYGIYPIEGSHPDTKLNYLWNNDGSNNWTTKGQMLWGKSSEKVGVYAYAPYLEGQEDAFGVVFNIPTDQSEGLEAADLLWWYKGIEEGKKADVAAKDFDGGTIDIAFRHALIKLTVNFTLASQFEGQNISIKEAWFHQSIDKVAINFTGSGNNGIPYVGMSATTASNATSIKMHNCSTEGKLSCEVLFFPHSLTKGSKLLTVTLSDGRDYILTLGEDLKLSEGYVTGVAYEMAVTVGKNKLEGGVITVSPWNDKSSAGDFYTDAAEYSEWDGAEVSSGHTFSGTGSERDPFIIQSATDLAGLAANVISGTDYKDNYFLLDTNIDLMGHEWAPIGCNGRYPFAGIFDGNGKTILNLKVSKGMYSGLFGVASGTAVIKNLNIRNASVISKVIGDGDTGGAGIVAGWCGGGLISGSSVEGTVAGDCYVGGIVGWIQNGSISDCTAEVSCIAESGSYSASGGIAGKSYSTTIENCTVRGEVKGTYMAGGFVGDMEEGGAIKRTQHDAPLYCYADVSLYGECASSLEAKEKYYVGGLVGKCSRSSSATVSITGVNVLGKVSLPDGLNIYEGVVNLGGYFGYVDNASISGNFLGSIEAGTPANGTLNAGAFIGMLGAEVTASSCKYYSSKVGGLPVYGAKADSADDSDLKITTFD